MIMPEAVLWAVYFPSPLWEKVETPAPLEAVRGGGEAL
jgi:hypothetical protein